MKTRSPLTGASTRPPSTRRPRPSRSMLAPQLASTGGRRTSCGRSADELGKILCPGQSRSTCDKIDTGGYRVTTTLDWKMQKTAEKWVYAAARAPNAKNPRPILTQPQDPDERLRAGSSACAGTTSTTPPPRVIDYRTGQVLAYVGSASYTVQGQQEVPAPVRRPRRRLAPARVVDQADRLRDRHRRRDPDRGDDVHGRRHRTSAAGFTPTQADKLERGPVRLRSALQFSLNIPSIKAGHHDRPRPLLRSGPRTSA